MDKKKAQNELIKLIELPIYKKSRTNTEHEKHNKISAFEKKKKPYEEHENIT